eukprot:TRINITY_DN4966_c0_g2_i2.p1 TRINITY_DN4966_c0_g2~~TRINITY_DN4966_c0_g2_i2.p1  ORF type:complete len:306 (-),score=22.83 TRINITY_DN4966_c0_g2_i2:86-1003(-)
MNLDEDFFGSSFRSLPSYPTQTETFSNLWDQPVYRSLGSGDFAQSSTLATFSQPRIRASSGISVPFSSPTMTVPDVPKESPGPRLSSSTTSSMSSSSFTLTSSPSSPAVSCSPGVQKLVAAAAATSAFPLSLPITSTTKSSLGPSTTLTRKTSTPTSTSIIPEHKTADARSVWLSFRPGSIFIRCIVHPVHIFFLLVRQLSASEWQVIELNQENRKRMIIGESLQKTTYTFNEKHKIELSSLGELNTLMPTKTPPTTTPSTTSFGGFGWGKEKESDYNDDFALEDLGDLPSDVTEELDMRMSLHD